MSDEKNVTNKNLTPEATRALEEAEAQRTEQEAKEQVLETQRSSEKGPAAERVRYGDWEKAGRAVDF